MVKLTKLTASVLILSSGLGACNYSEPIKCNLHGREYLGEGYSCEVCSISVDEKFLPLKEFVNNLELSEKNRDKNGNYFFRWTSENARATIILKCRKDVTI